MNRTAREGGLDRFPDRREVRGFLATLPLSDEEKAYARVHERRFVRALEVVGRCLRRRQAELPSGQKPLLCDVAPHILTLLFVRFLGVQVNSVGNPFDAPEGVRGLHEHMDYDLNRAHKWEGWQGFIRHDVVYLGEILEHLHASPRFVLGCVSRWVKDGGFLVVQTPNAVALSRRLRLLVGQNPYEMIRDGDDPGHFREYTAKELREIGRYWQLTTEEVGYENYFELSARGPVARTIHHLATLGPRSFRDGLTVVFRKPVGGPDPLAPSRLLRGHLEFLEVSGGLLTVAGWAVDTGLRGPCPLVEFVFDGFTFAGCAPAYDRPDVVQCLGGHKAYLRSGFHHSCPAPKGFDPARLVVRTRDIYGDVFYLPGCR